MPDIIETTLTLYRGRDYIRDEMLVDESTGASLLADGIVLQMVVKDSPAADATVRITLDERADMAESGLSGRDNDTGTITVCIRADDIDAIPGDASEPVRLFHTLAVSEPGDATSRAIRIGPCDIRAKV